VILFFVIKGITLKLNDQGRCMVARIMHGGMIHRQGMLFNVLSSLITLSTLVYETSSDEVNGSRHL